jgi:hypothetical protein
MKRLPSNQIGIDQGSVVLFSDFADGGPMWSGDGPRDASQTIRFATAFQTPPSVQVSLSMWDTSSGMNQRMDLRAENITVDGFDLVFRTWADSQVARVRADWMAIGALPDDELWDLY